MSSLGPNAGFGGLTGRFRQHLRRGGPALVMAAVGAAIGLPHAPGGATLAFLVATLASFGTRTGLAAGALALIAGVGVAPVAIAFSPFEIAGAALGGLALGLLLREGERLFEGLPPALIGALAALVLAFTLVIPSESVRLATTEGAPLFLPALIVDAASMTRVATTVPAEIDLAAPSALITVALAAALAAALFLLGARTRKLQVVTWRIAAVGGALGVVAGLAGLVQLMGSATLDTETMRHAYDLRASLGGSVLDLVVPPVAELRLWSRPFIDGLRLVPAVFLAGLAVRNLLVLRATPLIKAEVRADHAGGAAGLITGDGEAPLLGSWTPLMPLALAAAGLAAAALGLGSGAGALSGAALALIGGMALGLGALVASRFDPTLDLAPRVALVAVAVLWVQAWVVGPLFGA